ncbi:MAG: hypothetical protein AABW51_01765 [Nanoarchaeota archaeon]
MNFYKRYIHKNGKKLGPYYYSNKKVDGKVISTYLGTEPPSKFRQLKLPKNTLKFAIITLSTISLVLLVNLIFHLQLFSTGNIPLSTIDEQKTPKDIVSGLNNTNITNRTQSNPIQPTINTIQSQAVINQPVKWSKEIQLEKPGKIIVQLPKEAQNILVYKVNSDGQKEKVDDKQISITAKVSSEINIDQTREKKESPILKFFKKIISFITGKAVTIQDTKEIKEITINENAKEYVIEYETSSPTITEHESANGKTIMLSNAGSVSYQNVLVFTNIPETLNVKSPENIRVYWNEQNKFIQPEKIEDKNSNGIYDYIEWIAPSSDNQTFEIIVITKAEHLDGNRQFISDIYEQVKDIDDVWSEEIPSQDYVRITFEKNLTNQNDITIFPRIIKGNPRIEVYEENTNNLIAEFTNLTNEEYNTIYLTNLQGEQDVFDLKIIGGSLEFDHMIDPTAQPGGAPSLMAQVCSAEDNAAQGSFAGTCDGVYPRACGTGNDLVSCNDNIRETHTSGNTANWGGIKIQTFNSSVTNCQSISQVFFCYERWVSAATITQCDISVDANGGASYSVVTSICPTTLINSGITCTDVTSLESWACSNFFGASGTRALAKSEFRKSGGGGTRTMNWDVFYFNITYTQANQAPTIDSISSIPSLPPIENSMRPVTFNVSVSDPDGYTDITSVSAQFSMAGEPTRINSSCTLQNGAGNNANYSCTINMQYYDKDGNWNVTINVTDSQSQQGTNNSQIFVYQLLKAIVINSPTTGLTWPGLSQGQTNIFSNNDPTVIENTGNYQGPILITAFDLFGQTNPAQIISASNFIAGPASGLECTATQLSNNFQISIAGSNLLRGPGAQTQIYYCLNSVPLVSSQDYSASGASSWIIAV